MRAARRDGAVARRARLRRLRAGRGVRRGGRARRRIRRRARASRARFANIDTDDNAADFVALDAPTPGTAPLAAVPEPAAPRCSGPGLAGLAGCGAGAGAPERFRRRDPTPLPSPSPGPRRAAGMPGPARPACRAVRRRPAHPAGARSRSGLVAGPADSPSARTCAVAPRSALGGLDKARAERETRAAVVGSARAHRQHDHRVQHERPPRRPSVPRADRGQRRSAPARDQPPLLTAARSSRRRSTSYADLLGSDGSRGSRARADGEASTRRWCARLSTGDFDAVIRERLADPRRDTGPGASDPPLPAPARRRRRAAAAPPPRSAPAPARAFGEGIVSQKPLDEVILDYLVEKPAAAAPPQVRRTPRASRAEG